MKNLSDPTVVGPGVWWLIHVKAKEAISEQTIDEFIDLMYFLAQHFSCKKCRTHILNYIQTHPFSDLINLTDKSGHKIGMFKWSWMFHNAVNIRLNKPNLNWENAVEMFYGESSVCNSDCDESNIYKNIEEEMNQVINSYPYVKSEAEKERMYKLAQGYFNTVH